MILYSLQFLIFFTQGVKIGQIHHQPSTCAVADLHRQILDAHTPAKFSSFSFSFRKNWTDSSPLWGWSPLWEILDPPLLCTWKYQCKCATSISDDCITHLTAFTGNGAEVISTGRRAAHFTWNVAYLLRHLTDWTRT